MREPGQLEGTSVKPGFVECSRVISHAVEVLDDLNDISTNISCATQSEFTIFKIGFISMR